MKPDIHQKIEQDFGPQSSKAIEFLKNFEAEIGLSPRVSRCIIYLSRGSLNELVKNIELAKIDWRDLIIYAEAKEFDYNKPFETMSADFSK